MAKKAPDLLFHAGHRDRLKAKLESDKLTSAEKLELLLTYAIPRRDVRPTARALVQQFRSVYHVFNAPMDALTRVPGVGRNTALLIKLVSELMTVSYHDKLCDVQVLAEPFVLYEYLRKVLLKPTVEEVHVLYLDADKRLIHDETHSRGTFDKSNVYPDVIMRNALTFKARNVILAHNHPMSDNQFSNDDITLTQTIQNQLKFFNIDLLDHYVVTSNGTIHVLSETVWARKSSFFNK